MLALAVDLAARHGLRGNDPVVLACGLRAADVTGKTGLVCLDDVLNAAAVAEGPACLTA